MFVKLALRNVRRQIQNYLIYFVTVALSVALLFAVNHLSCSNVVRQLAAVSSDMQNMFRMVTILASLVTALALGYAASYMLKLRKREFGMYLTLGMTRRNIQALFICETGILSGLALAAGTALGLLIYQLLAALFQAVLELPVTLSGYSRDGFLLTLAVSLGMFLVSTLASLRFLRKVSVTALLTAGPAVRRKPRPVLWCVMAAALLAGLLAGLVITYRRFMEAFYNEAAIGLLFWLAADLVLVFLSHFALSKALAGMLLHSERLKNKGTNTVVLRSLSETMTINALLIGALATLLVFAVCLSNVALSDRIYTERSIRQDCPYDVMALFDLSQEPGISMAEGREIVETYSPIVSQLDYQLHSTGGTDLCGGLPGATERGWTDRFLPLSQFNRLLSGCGLEPVALDHGYLMVTSVRSLCEADLSDRTVTLNGTAYTWAGSSAQYPDFIRGWFCFVIPDEAVEGMPVSDVCAAYTLAHAPADPVALTEALHYTADGGDGPEERSDHWIQAYYRLYANANSGTLIVSTLYVSTVFVCMALAILSLKTLSTLEDERRRFAVLFRLGADERTQRAALFRQTGVFFLAPFLLPLLLTVPLGLLFGRVYEIWGFAGLTGRMAMETALLISLVILGVYALYFFLTYRIACGHVICHGGDRDIL